MPFGEITLGSKTTVTRDRPSSVFSADICLSSVCRLSLCAGAIFVFCVCVCVCVFIVSSVIMGQSSSTPLSVMTDHEDRESQKKKLILQESSLYPSLIDLYTEISSPPYMQPPLPPQLPQVSPWIKGGTQNPRLRHGKGGQPKELAEGLQGAETCLRTEAGRLLHPPFGHSLSGWGQ